MTDPEDYARLLPHWADGARTSAKVIIPLVLDLVGPKSVVDVGCGLGVWLAEFAAQGIDEVVGIDGPWIAPDQIVIPADRFHTFDLSKPFGVGRRFDLAVSLEVAEHLPESSASSFVASLAALSDVHLFSAAIPGQGGVGHLNEKWPSYWIDLFHAHGFEELDPIRPQIWNRSEVPWWYAQNIMMFATADVLMSNPQLRGSRSPWASLPLVHPRNYEAKRLASAHPLIALARRLVHRYPTLRRIARAARGVRGKAG